MEKRFKNIVQVLYKLAVTSGGCWTGREGSKDRKSLTNKEEKKTERLSIPKGFYFLRKQNRYGYSK